MAFGTAITNGAQVASGTYGYVVRFNLLSQEPSEIIQIQMEASGVLGDPVQQAVPIATLMAYLEDSACPDVAFFFSGFNLDVFLKTSVYAFIVGNRLGIWFYRNAQNVSASSSILDIPQEARELFKAMALEQAYRLKGKNLKYDVEEIIRSEKTALGL